MEVRGRVEYDDEVIHVIAHHMTDATASLHMLSEDMLNAPIARADHVNTPLPSKFNPRDNLLEGDDDPANGTFRPRDLIDELPNTRTHPRNVRLLPRMLPPSRDFH